MDEFIEDNGAFEVLAPQEDYLMTKQSRKLLSNFSLNGTVRVIGSEDALYEEIVRLYLEHKFFITVHYGIENRVNQFNLENI